MQLTSTEWLLIVVALAGVTFPFLMFAWVWFGGDGDPDAKHATGETSAP